MNAKLMTLAGSSLALAVALSTAASAQAVISRTITAEPVETVVTQTPAGAIVTRRPVDAALPAPGVAPTLVEPVAPEPTLVETVPDTVDAITTREVVRRAQVTRPAPALRTRQVSARPEPRMTRKVVRKTTSVRTFARPAPRLALTPRERHIVYQTIVEREVIPRREVVVAPAIAPAPYIASAPYATPAPLVTRQVGLPTAPAPLVAADEEVVVEGPIAVGAVLPPNTPLFAMPQNVALSVPAARAYSYAWIGGRAYLVNPATGVVVADITE